MCGRNNKQHNATIRLSNRTIYLPPSNMISRQRRQRRRAPPYATTSLTGLASSIGFVILLQSSFLVAWIGRHGHGLLFVSAHGYLKSPRSRNLVACKSVGRFRRIISTRNLCSHLTVHIIGPIIVDHVLSIQPQSRIRIGKHSWGGLAGATIPFRKIVSVSCINSIYGVLHTVSCPHVIRITSIRSHWLLHFIFTNTH